MIFNFFKQNGYEALEAEYLKASRGNNSNIFKFSNLDICSDSKKYWPNASPWVKGKKERISKHATWTIRTK